MAEIQGKWVTVGGDPNWQVHKKAAVFPGQRIQARSPAERSTITIILTSGAAKSVHCKQHSDPDLAKDPCATPIVIDDEPAPRGWSQRIVDSVMKMVVREDPERVMTVARDVFGPQSAVLAWSGDQLDLRPALGRVPEDSYLVELSPENAGSSNSKPARYSVTVGFSGAVSIKIGGLHGGLYRLALFSTADREQVGDSTVVLVTAGREFELARKAFGEAQQMTSQWGDNVAPGYAEYFLAQYLRVLASGAAGGP